MRILKIFFLHTKYSVEYSRFKVNLFSLPASADLSSADNLCKQFGHRIF